MVIFKDIVNLVLEATIPDVPDWFNKVLDKHTDLSKQPQITETDLEKTFFPLLDEPNIPEQSLLNIYKNKRILDFLQSLYDGMSSQPKDWNTFKTNLSQVENIGKSYNSKVQSFKLISDWKITNDKILKSGQASEKLADSKSEIALNTYGDKSVLDTVQAMINKRVDFFTRVAKLKSPTVPFTNLIKNVFSYPEDYLSGAKKYTSDFEGIDNFYISNLIDIALAAKNFFVSELSKYKTGQLQGESFKPFQFLINQVLFEANKIEIETLNNQKYFKVTDPSTPSKPEVLYRKTEKDALKDAQRFDPKITSLGQLKTRGDILGKMMSKKIPQQPTTPTKSTIPTLPSDALNKLQTDIPDRLNFLSGKPVQFTVIDPKTGKEAPQQVKSTPPYNVSKILSLSKPEAKNPEAVKLINALKAVSQHTRKKPGAGERMSQLGQAAGSLAAAAGVKLYG